MRRFAQSLAPPILHSVQFQTLYIALSGPLGAGKTTFTRHLFHALGVSGPIKSPTYAVLESYETTLQGSSALDLFHFDFYRLKDEQEWEDAGFRDLFAGPGLKLVEWPERLAGVLPLADIHIDLDFCEPPVAHPEPDTECATARSRQLRLTALTHTGRALWQQLFAA
jgi:tRNA threonylcarbamoyladenosine biosynthesis protein TsaE